MIFTSKKSLGGNQKVVFGCVFDSEFLHDIEKCDDGKTFSAKYECGEFMKTSSDFDISVSSVVLYIKFGNKKVIANALLDVENTEDAVMIKLEPIAEEGFIECDVEMALSEELEIALKTIKEKA